MYQPQPQQTQQTQQQQQPNTGGFGQFNQVAAQNDAIKRQQIQQHFQEQQQQGFHQGYANPQQDPTPVAVDPTKRPPELYHYNTNDYPRPIGLIVGIFNFNGYSDTISGGLTANLSPKVIYDQREAATAQMEMKFINSFERSMDRFTSGDCFGDFRQISLPKLSSDFFINVINCSSTSAIKKEKYDVITKYFGLDNKMESNYGQIAVYCGMYISILFKMMNTGNLRASGKYLLCFIEGAKQLQSYQGELYHLIDDYKDGDFTVGKELTTKYPISCTNNPQVVMDQAMKHKTNFVLKFVNAPAKIMPHINGLNTFDEAVVLPGCKVKVSKVSQDSGLNVIELYPVDTVWSDDHFFRKKGGNVGAQQQQQQQAPAPNNAQNVQPVSADTRFQHAPINVTR